MRVKVVKMIRKSGFGHAGSSMLMPRFLLKRIGVRDVFGKSGTNEEMKEKFGLRAEDIAKEVLSFLEN